MRTPEPESVREMSANFGGRWRWLGHPAFLGCVLLLAYNDRVLKYQYPGWWTGKLSDFAGVAIAATVAAVIVGTNRGLALTGAGFVLLKTIPGAAELASPVLGGVTRRDPTDLIALSILIPLAIILRHHELPRDHHSVFVLARSKSMDLLYRCRTAVSATVPVVGAIAAVMVMTATSQDCGPGPYVTLVMAEGDTFYAAYDSDYENKFWARSQDGGLTWETSDAPATAEQVIQLHEAAQDFSPTSPLKACDSDETCWRVRDQHVIERRSIGSEWVKEFHLSKSEFAAIAADCGWGQVGVLHSLAVVDGDSGPLVVASLGANGVVARQANGQWSEVAVLSASPD